MEVPGLDKLRDFKSGKIIVNEAFEKRKCPVCKKDVTKEIGRVDVFPILECERCNLNFCGLVSKNNLGFNINDDRSRRYDANKFRPSKNALKSEKRFLYRELKGYVDFKRPLKFLDFGSGSGAMIGAALSLNWKAYSVEINPDLRNLVGNYFILKFFVKAIKLLFKTQSESEYIYFDNLSSKSLPKKRSNTIIDWYLRGR